MPATVALPGRRRAKVWTAINPAAPLGSTYNDSGTGTIGIGGIEGGYGSGTYGGGTYAGVYNESHSRDMSASGTIALSGVRTETSAHASSASGQIPLSGYASESYVPPGGAATKSRRPTTGFGK
jgi:hypothetical protein